MSTEQPTLVLMLIAKNEEALSRLYHVYAERLPEHAAFWQRLSEDELRHQEWAQGLVETYNKGLLQVDELRANPDVYLEFLQYLELTIQESLKHPLTMHSALVTAHAAEQTYIERNLLTTILTESPDVQNVLAAMSHSTEGHARVIAQALHELPAEPAK